MSIGTVYEKAYKGDFNQVKVHIDSDETLVTTVDSVSIVTFNFSRGYLFILFLQIKLLHSLCFRIIDFSYIGRHWVVMTIL